jgi:FkbM family methyltransferase
MLVRFLDRPGGRLLLGKMATRFVRRATSDDLEIAYRDGLWTRRVGPHFFPDSPRFEYASGELRLWAGTMARYLADTKEYWLWQYRPKAGDTIVDVGAGHGEDAVTFSRAVGASGRVIAIEAHPLSFAILKNFCRLNRLENVTVVHLALTDRPGTVGMAESPSSWMEHSIAPGSGPAGLAVPADALDALCAREGIRDIAFLKMNIEGAERDALLGMKAMLPNIRQICVACHDFRAELGHGEQFRTRAFVQRYLAERGFQLSSRSADPRAYVRDHVHGIRPA